MAGLFERRSLVRFGIVGVVGFAVDAGVLQALLVLGWDQVAARAVAIPVAVFATWLLNRSFTFPEAQPGPALASLARYAGVSAFGAAVNFIVYTALVLASASMASQPLLALAIGSEVAMVVNYRGSRHNAFKSRPAPRCH
jgi:putative flippase GtrA